ncbi:hypothetical protein [Aeromicrobium massiliense]|uniref:hypothetical protein n=1 Tax=Aeromicrobium massiliense TaxID=1464554 RepID=UPI0002F0099D|nr:hypothetical protein [Aeromicrobium massiliense]
MHLRSLALAALVLLPLSGCSDDPEPREHAATSFESMQPEGATALAEAYRRTGTQLRQDVTIPDGSGSVLVALDCVAPSGDLSVQLKDGGGASIGCGEHVGDGPGFVSLDYDLTPGPRQMTVTAPEGAEWSFAVYPD